MPPTVRATFGRMRMATTKMWPIKDSVARVIAYADNPQKTAAGLSTALHYATDEVKTEAPMEEKRLFITALNCNGDPTEAMLRVQQHFGKTGGNVAYHAYQSFKPGEITPEQCHAIGVALARAMWGDRYQVVVATHLNKAHLHNHFVWNSVSFLDGKKYDDNKGEYRKLRRISDELCQMHRLSVIENPGKKTPRQIHFAEKAGKETRYSLMAQAIRDALEISSGWDDLCHHLHDMGYDFQPNFGRKYATIRRLSEAKPIRIFHLGEEFTRERMDSVLRMNRCRRRPDYEHYYKGYRAYNLRMRERPAPLPWCLEQYRRKPSLLGLVCAFVALLGGPDLLAPEEPPERYEPLTPDMMEARNKMELYSRQAVLMGREHLETKEDCDRFLDRNEANLATLTRKRSDLYNGIRRCTKEETRRAVKAEIHAVSKEISIIRRESKDIRALLTRSGVMEQQVEAERIARMQKTWREYDLPPEECRAIERDAPDRYQSPKDGTVTNASSIRKGGRNDR